MECDEFISGYSSYRDGLLDTGREERFRDHLATCDSCSRYDRVVRRGTEVLRDLPRPEPSPDFLARLRHRLYHVRDDIPLNAARDGGTAVVALAAVGLLAFAWLPFATQVSVEVELPAVAVEEPARPGPEVDASSEPGAAAETAEMPLLFEPGVLGGVDGTGTAAAWPAAATFWPRGGRGMSAGLPAGRAGPSFLAATGTSPALAR